VGEIKKPLRYYACSVARSLDILGDRWVFLIIRELFFGIRNYDQIHDHLAIATNILSDRLKILVDNGIVEKKKDALDKRKYVYKLTEKGLDLYPITLALLQWGDKWLAGDKAPPLFLYHKTCGQRLEPVMVCRKCGGTVHPRDVRYQENEKAI